MANRNFERALRSAARRGRTAGVCPDAAMLAAYVDRSLSAHEHAAVEAHVADCTACIEHLALVAALDAPEESPVPAPRFDLGKLVGRWGWLVPAMTAVLVVAVWMRSSEQRPADASLTPASRSAARPGVQPQGEAAAPDRYASSAEADESRAKAASPTAPGGSKKADAPAHPSAPASAQNAAKPAAPAPPAEAQSKEAQQLADLAAAEEKDKESGQTRRVADAAAPPVATSSPATAADTREGARAKIAPEPVSGAASTTAHMRKAVRRESVTSGNTILVRTTSGRIDRSTDGGQSWTNERAGLTDRIQVTLCPTATACWLGADNGAVFVRTTDGEWVRRVVPPPAAAVERIVALDNQHATVELSDGRRYVTVNGGITWTVPPPQP